MKKKVKQAHTSAPESRDRSTNGASLKSQMSRGNTKEWLTYLLISLAVFFVGCNGKKTNSMAGNSEVEEKADPRLFLIGKWVIDSTWNSAGTPEKSYQPNLFKPVSMKDYNKMKSRFYFTCDSTFKFEGHGMSIVNTGYNNMEMAQMRYGTCNFIDTTYYVRQSDMRGYDCKGVFRYTHTNNGTTYTVPIKERTDSTMVIDVVDAHKASGEQAGFTELFFNCGKDMNAEVMYLKKVNKP